MKKELLFSLTKKDFDIEFTKGSGKGGQNRNKRETAVRITHRESGVVSYCCDQREQHQNLKLAFKRLTENPKFKLWLKLEAGRRSRKKEDYYIELEKRVLEAMQERNLKVEYYTPED